MEYPNRLTDAFEEHGMTVVKIPVIQLATAGHEVELRELVNKTAAAWNDRANKKMYVTSFFFIVQPTC